ncbi:MAG TPA: efflux RND transporter periplasmic adaptor subunit, partial [Candidatus Kapabacteria bacterium]|nr:efflux RND transporter periplasmic adaptor subunit [Candidatus Kapabacteria bacterium]
AAAPVTVKTAQVEMTPMAASLKVSGSLEGIREAVVSSETNGRIVSQVLNVGSRIGQGSAIVQVDAELKNIGVQQAAAQRLAAEAAFEKAELDHERNEQLFKQNAITKNQLEISALGVKSAQAQLKGAQTSESLAKRQLSDAAIKSPFAGLVSQRFVNQGETVTPGVRIATIIDDSRMKLKVNIGEMEVGYLKTGDRVTVTVDALPGQQFSGRVAAISGKADMARTFSTEIEIENPGKALKSGMFARAEIMREAAREVAAIPANALITNGSKTQVYLVKKGVAHLTAVKAGTATTELVEILEGVNAGDEVVTFGQSQLKDGSTIRK